LERSTPAPTLHEPVDVEEGTPATEPEPAERGRGPKRGRVETKPAKKIKGRTIYLPDDLFERILVQAHRRNKTISEYVTALLDRQVPDHRIVRAEPAETEAA
jgi:hypothetical protein